jgi:hypothetical protein
MMHAGSIRPGCGGALEDIVSLTRLATSSKNYCCFLKDKKLWHEPITCLTAYDYASARGG